LLPATYALPPIAALIMLAGIYYGSQYGGSTTAILLNIPGETSSVVTAIDGYQMARNGRAGVALFTAGMGSFFAGCVATLVLAAFAAPLSQLAFKFGPDGLRLDRCRCFSIRFFDQSDWHDHLGSLDGLNRY
jgi:TctA family transporter